LASIESRTLFFDDENLQWQLVIKGSSFYGTPRLQINKKSQELKMMCQDTLVFVIDDLDSERLTNLELYFEDGLPENYWLITDESDDLVMTPELISVSPNKHSIQQGTFGGTRLEITVPGVGSLSDFDVVVASLGS
jgi:hypothetical protein